MDCVAKRNGVECLKCLKITIRLYKLADAESSRVMLVKGKWKC